MRIGALVSLERIAQALNAQVPEDFGSKLSGWVKSLANYQGYRPDLRASNLQRCDLSDLTFSGARFDHVRMGGADLRQVRMQGARLWQARMEGTELYYTQLFGTDLSMTNISQAQVNWALGDASVYLPTGIKAPPHWSIAGEQSKTPAFARHRHRHRHRQVDPGNRG